MSARYPTDIVTTDGDGWARIHKGHGLDKEMLREDVIHNVDDQRVGEVLVVEEVHLSYTPRVKWCSRHSDGWGCDHEGEWHGHWFAVRPGADTAFTLARWGEARDGGESK